MESSPEANRWDAIVVGAGPAGSALARRLAARHRVLLLERAPPPGPARPTTAWRIGESLPGAAAVLLRRLGLLDRFLADGPVARGASVSTWDSAVPTWFDPLRDPNGPGWHLDRLRFDAMLRDAAREAGAVLAPVRGRVQAMRDGAQWRVRDDGSGQAHAAAVIVDATGRGASLCRGLDLARDARDRLVCVHAMLPASTTDTDQCTRTCADADGWWYSVRVPSGRRVLAFHLDADDAALHGLRDARVLLARARRHPLLAEVLPERAHDVPSHVRPAGSAALDVRACAARAGAYAVGDAVLAVDPLSSQGLFHALASADGAAAAIARQLDGDAAAGLGFFAEMHEVQARYRAHLAATYAGPLRYRERRFWLRRCGAAGAGRSPTSP